VGPMGRGACHLAVAAAWILVAGCTEANPDYEPPRSDGPGADCVVGERRCTKSTTQVCSGAGRWLNERRCPSLSSCGEGICVPSGSTCDSTADCSSGQACTVFVDLDDPSALATYCAGSTGFKPGGSSCSSHEQCASGLCLQRGTRWLCFAACSDGHDCWDPSHRCASVYLTVNGVQAEVRSCVPAG